MISFPCEAPLYISFPRVRESPLPLPTRSAIAVRVASFATRERSDLYLRLRSEYRVINGTKTTGVKPLAEILHCTNPIHQHDYNHPFHLFIQKIFHSPINAPIHQ